MCYSKVCYDVNVNIIHATIKALLTSQSHCQSAANQDLNLRIHVTCFMVIAVADVLLSVTLYV